MQHISLVKLAHQAIKEKLRPGDFAIDATLGNGLDTVFLAEQVGPLGRVYGFDIQRTAVEAVALKLANWGCLTLIRASHAEMDKRIPAEDHGNIRACMFNLGYLPGGDKRIITQAESTLTALAMASRILADNGVLTILAYPGHPGGELEALQVKNWCEQLDKQQFKAQTFYSRQNQVSAPRLFVVNKMALANDHGQILSFRENIL